MRQTAYITINGQIPIGIKPLNGKIQEGYLGPVFRENNKGNSTVRYQALTFIRLTELSNGSIVETEVW